MPSLAKLDIDMLEIPILGRKFLQEVDCSFPWSIQGTWDPLAQLCPPGRHL